MRAIEEPNDFRHRVYELSVDHPHAHGSTACARKRTFR
jgi:hypothetical protein